MQVYRWKKVFLINRHTICWLFCGNELKKSTFKRFKIKTNNVCLILLPSNRNKVIYMSYAISKSNLHMRSHIEFSGQYIQ